MVDLHVNTRGSFPIYKGCPKSNFEQVLFWPLVTLGRQFSRTIFSYRKVPDKEYQKSRNNRND